MGDAVRRMPTVDDTTLEEGFRRFSAGKLLEVVARDFPEDAARPGAVALLRSRQVALTARIAGLMAGDFSTEYAMERREMVVLTGAPGDSIEEAASQVVEAVLIALEVAYPS